MPDKGLYFVGIDLLSVVEADEVDDGVESCYQGNTQCCGHPDGKAHALLVDAIHDVESVDDGHSGGK